MGSTQADIGFGVSWGSCLARQGIAKRCPERGLQAIYKGPNTSKKHPQHRIYPYLLRKLPITCPNHVWCSDITYIPVRRGFLYLVAIMDWATRKVLAWRSTIVLGPMADKVSLKHTGCQLLR